jgi:hypothetical protein
MTARALATPKFLRKTTLRGNESNARFTMIDDDIVAAVSSPEADRVTPLMSKIYLRLLQAAPDLWEGERQLRFGGEDREGKWMTAWAQLCCHLNVSSETANKALRWMHAQGIIGYSAFKNGVGIRIFLNRAANSIAIRTAPAGEKFLPSRSPSPGAAPASSGEAPFNDKLKFDPDRKDLLNPRAPDGAEQAMETSRGMRDAADTEVLVEHVRAALEPALREAASRAAAHEHERTREWLESRGLPKAARVAQHEAYNVLRKYGVVGDPSRASRSQLDVGRNSYTPPEPQPLTEGEVSDFAKACAAMLDTKGQSIEMTLSEMSAEAGGFLLPGDAARVRVAAQTLLDGEAGKEG